jgi:Zn-dependent M28 family amino/carboxypeptidase
MRRIVIAGSLTLIALAALIGAPPQSKKASSPGAGAAASAAFGNSDAITEEELKVYLYFLASDELEGRNLPSRGYDTAALYVASHLAEWGLKPGGSTGKTDGPLQPYLMPIELMSRTVVAEESKASILAPAGRGGRGGRGNASGAAAPATPPAPVALEYGKDWTAPAGGRGAPPVQAFDAAGPMVFAGNGYVIHKQKQNPYEGLDVKGKIIVVAGVPPEIAAQQAALAGRGGRGQAAQPNAQQPETAAGRAGDPTENPLGEPCVDFLTPQEYGAKNGALAVVTVANFQQMSAMANPNLPAAGGFGGFGGGGGRGPNPNGPAYFVPKLQNPPACPVVPTVTAGMGMLNQIFQGERTAAPQVFNAAAANTRLDPFALNAEKKLSLKLEVKSQEGHGENVVGILEGADPVLKNEYVVVSAHLDHIGLSATPVNGDSINNGADDDGSGSVGLMAMARAYAEGAAKGIRPKRSMIFLWNAGEEKGLWGSQYFNRYPPFDITKVVADLNMDMIGRTKGPNYADPDPTHALVKPDEVFVIGPHISSDDMATVIETVNAKSQKMALNHFYDTTAPDETHDNLGPQPRGQRIFYRSDHYNFAKMGIPIAFFTVGLHPDYHRPSDSAEKIDYKEIQMISKTVGAVGWVLATQPGRPQLKAKLPDQLVKDMKSAKDQGWGKTTPILDPLPGMPK